MVGARPGWTGRGGYVGRARRAGLAAALSALPAVFALAAAGCSGPGGTEVLDAPTTTTRGGIATLLGSAPIATWDPQRLSDPAVAALAGRLTTRTLTAYAPPEVGAGRGDGVGQGVGELVGDLASDLGEHSADLRTWTFTLRPGVAWQDGSPVTCADVRHGIARTFATDVVTGGATDAITVLAIPKNLDGRSTYRGPWATGPEADTAAAAFDQAVSCAGEKVTFALGQPVSDFPEMLAQVGFAPVRAGHDATLPTDTTATTAAAAGEQAGMGPWSNGPYQLQGEWSPETGGTLVRNPHWTASSDRVRKAYPDRIVIRTGLDPGEVVSRVLRDGDDAVNAVSLDAAPLALQQHLSAIPTVRARALVASTELVDYLAVAQGSTTLARPEVRQALALATNRTGYVTSLGGPLAARVSASVIPPALPARAKRPVTVQPADPAAARRLLVAAGVTLPVPLRVVHRSGPSADKAMAALVAGWQDAGFAPQVTPIAEDYFRSIATPQAATAYDVYWSTWAPTWGSASTVLPPLFDPGLNLTSAGTGRDVGSWNDATWTTSLAAIASTADPTAREQAWAAADDRLLAAGAYVALAERYAVHLAGSGVRNLVAQPHSGGMADLAVLGVAQ